MKKRHTPASGLYLCRWPNGDFSIVKARNKREAILLLDELGPAELSFLLPLQVGMFDFGLTDDGEIQLKEIGEETLDVIFDHCYPELRDFLHSEATGPLHDGGHTPAEVERARELLKQVVERERTRLKDEPRSEAQTELGRDLQKQLGASAIVADAYVKQRARKILKATSAEKSKPN